MPKLTTTFFNRPTLQVAKDLLGKYLVRKVGNKVITGMITETEAYVGPNDKANHASRGLTPRTEVMFGPAGHFYIYLIYGMYYCLNIVTEKSGYPAAVLIRAVKVEEAPYQQTNGPGKLCRFFQIDKSLNGKKVTGGKLWLEDRGVIVKLSQIKRTPRIGVEYAGKWKDKKWRFVYIIDK